MKRSYIYKAWIFVLAAFFCAYIFLNFFGVVELTDDAVYLGLIIYIGLAGVIGTIGEINDREE